MPKPARTAYTLFCQAVLPKLKEQFPDMQGNERMKMMVEQWKNIGTEDRNHFEAAAVKDNSRYNYEMREFVFNTKKSAKTPKRKRKLPGQPKRWKSPYIFFSKSLQLRLAEEDPERRLAPSEILKEIGRRWNELGEEERMPFKAQSEEDRRRYEEEMAIFKAQQVEEPKRIRSAYNLFFQATRPKLKEQFPHVENNEVTKMLADQWKNLSTEERREYEEAAEKDKARFTQEMESYKAWASEQGQDLFEGQKASGAYRKADPNMPKPARTAYTLFCQTTRPKLKEMFPDLHGNEIMRMLVEKWKNLSTEERSEFEAAAERDEMRHTREMWDYVPGAHERRKSANRRTKLPGQPKRWKSPYIFFSEVQAFRKYP